MRNATVGNLKEKRTLFYASKQTSDLLHDDALFRVINAIKETLHGDRTRTAFICNVFISPSDHK